MLSALANLPPELIWGLMSRGLGVVYLAAFTSLQRQVLPIAGSRGVTPAQQALRAIERDFPTWKRFVYFPTLLWLGCSDRVLSLLPRLGICAALVVIVGGPAAPWALGVCYAVHLSLDRVLLLGYPWDCLLFEAGFWAVLLPATHVLPDVTAVTAPLPALAWLYRLLLFRIIFGFGKTKFLGTTTEDRGYLKSFVIYLPLPTPLAWFVHKLPMWVHQLGLAGLFATEIVLPFTVFVPGPWSVVGALAVVGLMAAIWLSSNFAFFNLLTIVLTLSWFDTQTALAFRSADLWQADHAFVHGLLLVHTFGALLSLPFNTFCASTWLLWPIWERVRPRFLTWPLDVLRALHPLRWLHAYGIFPPRSFPPVKILPVLEATWDERTWHTIPFLYSPTQESSVPRFFAPRWDRLDQMASWEGMGLNDASVLRNFVGRWEPYGYGGTPGARLLVQRMLDGDMPGEFYDRSLERRLGPPLLARVRTYLFEVASWAELTQRGKWWRRTLIGPHYPPLRRGDGFSENVPPPPELWHFNDLLWLRRSGLQALMLRAQLGEDPHGLVLTDIDVSSAELDEFWHTFLPSVRERTPQNWLGVRQVVEQVRARYDRRQLYHFERIAARYGVLLFAKLEGSLMTPSAAVRLRPDQLRVLCSHIVCEGRAAYDAVVRDPQLASSHLERYTLCSGLYLQAILRYEALLFQSQKLRLTQSVEQRSTRVSLFESHSAFERLLLRLVHALGAVDMVEFLCAQFDTPDDVLDTPEAWPSFGLLPSGAVILLDRAPRRSAFQEAAVGAGE